MSAVVFNVRHGSIAHEAGITVGDTISKVNKQSFVDVLDYRFLCSDEFIELEIIKNNGDIEIISIENPDIEELGIEFEDALIDGARSCCNKCIFCFIDQMPKGMRKSLYFKDDDTRLSFLQGNYVTLTNLTNLDIEKIIKMRISPINISVHSTDPVIRAKMIGNKNADVLATMQRFAQHNITMNCQIVCCPGVNDGEYLSNTLNDLANMFPHVNSVSVVPVGITKYRDKLYNMMPYDKMSALSIVERVAELQVTFLAKHGSRIAFLADEFYLLSDICVPQYNEYEGFPQLENGVGMIASFKQEFLDFIEDNKKNTATGFSVGTVKKKISIATGVLSRDFIEGLVASLEEYRLDIQVFAVKNVFFGENITVAGLVTGQDLANQLQGKCLGDELFIPESMLRSGDVVFLDDVTVQQVSDSLKIKITALPNDGAALAQAILQAVV